MHIFQVTTQTVYNKLILHGNACPSTGYYAEVGLLTHDAVRKVHSAVMKS